MQVIADLASSINGRALPAPWRPIRSIITLIAPLSSGT
jgi:hypothetical protein